MSATVEKNAQERRTRKRKREREQPPTRPPTHIRGRRQEPDQTSAAGASTIPASGQTGRRPCPPLSQHEVLHGIITCGTEQVKHELRLAPHQDLCDKPSNVPPTSRRSPRMALDAPASAYECDPFTNAEESSKHTPLRDEVLQTLAGNTTWPHAQACLAMVLCEQLVQPLRAQLGHPRRRTACCNDTDHAHNQRTTLFPVPMTGVRSTLATARQPRPGVRSRGFDVH